MLESLYQKTVPLIKPERLKEKLTHSKQVVLLDIRSKEEYDVSHIEGAHLISYEGFKAKDVAKIDQAAEVIVYCSVGYRSERIGERLLEMGFENVYNLYGGIFQWKNEDNEVVNAENTKTDSVHTYNKNWSKWLEKGIKVYE
ncbi:rhodanese-like domain-containing protein [Fulvivirgaceae bacterium BMA10]|uniref:Rhodanese-like domain-containing protein n=1 Tax=Splendidivirga corallicola TaxID=3051826 RepID=A0ABT8KS18_9BACT|nr:rhodanese-like domain-containing protein [Fulvivirgaceae bacterium BMA10]